MMGVLAAPVQKPPAAQKGAGVFCHVCTSRSGLQTPGVQTRTGVRPCFKVMSEIICFNAENYLQIGTCECERVLWSLASINRKVRVPLWTLISLCS